MPDNSHVSGLIDSATAAAYIAEMSQNLSKIARRHGLDPLAFILDMARLEAEGVNVRCRASNQAETTSRDEHSE
jgi:hypothetical protein